MNSTLLKYKPRSINPQRLSSVSVTFFLIQGGTLFKISQWRLGLYTDYLLIMESWNCTVQAWPPKHITSARALREVQILSGCCWKIIQTLSHKDLASPTYAGGTDFMDTKVEFLVPYFSDCFPLLIMWVKIGNFSYAGCSKMGLKILVILFGKHWIK